MKIVFTGFSIAKSTGFAKLKPSSFRFEEEGCTLKVIATPDCSAYSGNGTVEDAIGTIAGAINEAPAMEKSRLLLELELVSDYYKFKENEEMTNFLDKILEKAGEEDDWD